MCNMRESNLDQESMTTAKIIIVIEERAANLFISLNIRVTESLGSTAK